jgi:cytochrome c553
MSAGILLKYKTIRNLIVILLGIGVIGVAGFALFVILPSQNVPALEVVDEYIYLDQGWGGQENSIDRQLYYYTPQGTSMPQGRSASAIRYEWFVHLELPFSTNKFSSPDNMRRWRFLVDPAPSLANPYQLPVGFTKHFNKDLGENVLDITCAACHTGELHYSKEGKKLAIRIDGGQAMHALTDTTRGSFAVTLIASLADTVVNPVKFSRFAKNVLGSRYPQGKDALRSQLKTSLKGLLTIGQNNPLRGLYPVQEGYGRTDALGRIGNTVFGDHLNAKNYQQGGAPVSFPYLWNIWKFNWVQYNASVAQPLSRNIGEALGVGAQIRMISDTGAPLPIEQRFSSSVRIPDLVKIEKALQKLTPPPWPEQIFGPVDQAKATAGSALFAQHCVACHGPHIATTAKQQAEAPLKFSAQNQWLIDTTTLEHIGTDGAAALGFLNRRYDLSSTGITDVELHEILRPLQQRQLVRNIRWRLAEVIRLRETASLTVDGLPELLAAYPDIDAVRQVTMPYGYLSSIDKTMQQLLPSDYVTPELDKKPIAGWACNLNCQTQFLLWNINHGEQSIVNSLNMLSVTELTEGEALNLVDIMIKDKFYAKYDISYKEQMCLEGFGTLDLPQQVAGYKPRPLEGVWSTPPFLHNGSVPNVYQMLIPPSQRTKSFYLGNRDYDPEHLGYVIIDGESEKTAGFLFDTTIKGNLNSGHAFVADSTTWAAYKADITGSPLPSGVIGPMLTEQERMALLEYLKVRQDSPKGEPYKPDSCQLLVDRT